MSEGVMDNKIHTARESEKDEITSTEQGEGEGD